MSARDKPAYLRKIAIIVAVGISAGVLLAYAVFFPVALTDIVSITDNASLRQTAEDSLPLTDDTTPSQTTKDSLLPTDSAYQNNQNAADTLVLTDDTYQNNQNAADSMGLNDSAQPSSETRDVVLLNDFVTRNFFVFANDTIGLTDQTSGAAETPEPPEPPEGDGGRDGGGSGGPNRKVYDESYFIRNPLERLQVRSVYMQDSGGNVIQNAKVNEAVDISVTTRNYQQIDQQYVVVAQICDSDRMATAILYSMGTVKDADAADTSISWTPDSAGSYVVKIMIWDELSNPMLLSESFRKDISVAPS